MIKLKLKDIVHYSKERISFHELSVQTYVSTDNLLQNKQGVTQISKLPASANNSPKYKIGDILVSNIRPYLKKIYYAKHSGGVSADVLTFTVKREYDSRFVYYNLFQDAFFEHMMAGSKGTKMPRGDKNQILEFEIPDIRLEDQQQIASVLSALDDKIELNNEINAELEAMAKTLYDYWFVQFDFPNAEGKPYKASGGEMVYNEVLKREIPKGWKVKSLEACLESIIDYRGKTPKKLQRNWSENRDDIIALSAKHVKKGKLVNLCDANRVDDDLYKMWMKEPLKEGDILLTSEAPCGEFFYLIGHTKYCLSQRLFALRANRKIIQHSLLYYELSSGTGYSQILGKVSGSTVFGIRQDELRTVNIQVPCFQVQTAFHEFVETIYKKIRNNDYQNRELTSLRDWLLPMLMNGQIKVVEAYNNVADHLGMVAEADTVYRSEFIK